jgi:hypothetical protein
LFKKKNEKSSEDKEETRDKFEELKHKIEIEVG